MFYLIVRKHVLAGPQRNSAVGALLKNKHPELFHVAPRPGGFIKRVQKPPPNSTKIEFNESELLSSTKASIHGGETQGGGEFSDNRQMLNDDGQSQHDKKLTKEEERNNMVQMCSVAISTVMMMAQHTYKDITAEHVSHTEEYFRNLKQDGCYPPNIGQLLKILGNLKKIGKIAAPVYTRDNPEDENDDIQISDLIN
ncbi:uncharacterized protein LOC107263063 isoform X2 [Cephus cinctus]|uniref:Uncharacterized protein LOC107263063 isoform X2 n=1 Tax=Cephus cinctus TaxID=211228 RepID=A0AAJ7R987_CEPCN|nr:uncharacterized protein LOC107263063 isoform X2 [Cephus cinctus]